MLNPITGKPVAYKLVPHTAPPLLAHPSSTIASKGHFATKALWVTPHDEGQRFPAGDYVLNATQCRGLKEWTKEVGLCDSAKKFDFGGLWQSLPRPRCCYVFS